ncbi:MULTISPECIES: pantetheine-phosphate adenylyltransferase [unclassified Micromonospora]|uniref:pantetheine-phosphate adenylyltransferase n=1 Tax=unclassified Micromonospora TaxID=2617518 RepID=UPI0022B66261|nr:MULTISPECIES: pantetheine-phosphate adenylyltransferase [unclassified Micromonospora]MCZ7423427.1 pantetheine-phosphate adenylyltransferase [Verrucosispora sp. WMMA2121]WBB91122.1 pantetheine-phosphate adenylyltransferase [Verrucosispora sp. WMMC514]
MTPEPPAGRPATGHGPGRARVRAVYPGSFDPFTAGHLDVVRRARDLFDDVVVLVAVNGDKQPGADQERRAAAVRAVLPVGWTSVTVVAWRGLTSAYCHAHEVSVIVRGVRDTSDLQAEHRLAAMNRSLGVPTVFLAARPGLTRLSSTAVRTLGTSPRAARPSDPRTDPGDELSRS